MSGPLVANPRAILAALQGDKERAAEVLKSGEISWACPDENGVDYKSDSPEVVRECYQFAFDFLVDQSGTICPGVVLRDAKRAATAEVREQVRALAEAVASEDPTERREILEGLRPWLVEILG